MAKSRWEIDVRPDGDRWWGIFSKEDLQCETGLYESEAEARRGAVKASKALDREEAEGEKARHRGAR